MLGQIEPEALELGLLGLRVDRDVGHRDFAGCVRRRRVGEDRDLGALALA